MALGGRRGSVQGGFKCFKYTMVVFNTLVILYGISVLVLGILMSTRDGSTNVSGVGGISSKMLAHFLIGMGAVTFVIAFFGCAGAAFEKKVLLAFYFVFMIILTICFLVVMILAIGFQEKMAENDGKVFEEPLIKEYGTDKIFTESWDKMQTKLQCCGLKGDVNSNTSWAFFTETPWYKNQKGAKRWVPESCCKKLEDSDIAKCRDSQSLIPVQRPPVTKNATANDLIYKEGCLKKVTAFIGVFVSRTVEISLTSVFVTTLASIFSCCLCVAISRGENNV